MPQRKRSRLSPTQETDVWKRWKAGQSLHEIGRAFDKPHTSIRHFLLPRGGIAPATRRRSRLALTFAEREAISRGIASGWSMREIVRRMNRAASTVSREVRRHGYRLTYRAHDADRQAWVSALRPKRCLLALNRKLRDIVASKLILDWSPEIWIVVKYFEVIFFAANFCGIIGIPQHLKKFLHFRLDLDGSSCSVKGAPSRFFQVRSGGKVNTEMPAA